MFIKKILLSLCILSILASDKASELNQQYTQEDVERSIKFQELFLEATRSNDTKKMQQLLKNGANVDGFIIGTKSSYKHTPPIVVAAQRNNDEAMKLLVQNSANVNLAADFTFDHKKYDNASQSTPLTPYFFSAIEFTAQHGNAEATKLLIQAGAVPTCGQTRTTALKEAVKRGDTATLYELLQSPKFRYMIDEINTYTALIYAAQLQAHDKMQLLLQNNADPNVHIPSFIGKKSETSPLVESASLVDVQAVEMLLQAHANPDLETRWGTAEEVAASTWCLTRKCAADRATIIQMLQNAKKNKEAQ